MTSMLTTGYAEVDFSPNQVFANIKKVCWDQNQTDLGNRKWTQVVVVPEGDFQQNGGQLNYANPALPVTTDNGHPISSDTFMFVMLRGSSQTYTGPASTTRTSTASRPPTRPGGSGTASPTWRTAR